MLGLAAIFSQTLQAQERMISGVVVSSEDGFASFDMVRTEQPLVRGGNHVAYGG